MAGCKMSGVNLVTQRTTDKDELFVCPYDPVHKISAKRFPYHIVKCRKNHPHLEMATCPFNARHIVVKPDLRHHTETCPDRNLVEMELHNMNNLSTSELPNDHVAASNEEFDFGDDEDWDEEIAKNRHESFGTSSNGFLHANTGKKINERREMIMRMKQQKRQEAEFGPRDMWTRRPNVEIGGKAQAIAMAVKANELKNATQTGVRPKPKLAVNFSVKPKGAVGIGRGRYMSDVKEVIKANKPTPEKERNTTHNVLNGMSAMHLDAQAKANGHYDAALETDWGFDSVRMNRRERKKQLGK